jgi:hypothetical protein
MFSAISNFHHDCRIMKRTACASGPQGLGDYEFKVENNVSTAPDA